MSPECRIRVVAALLKGHSIRVVSEMTGVPCNSVRRLLLAVGNACAECQERVLGPDWRRIIEGVIRANGFSKNLNAYVAAVSLHFMAAGVTDRVWEVADIVKLLDNRPVKVNYRFEAHYGSALGHEPGTTSGRKPR